MCSRVSANQVPEFGKRKFIADQGPMRSSRSQLTITSLGACRVIFMLAATYMLCTPLISAEIRDDHFYKDCCAAVIEGEIKEGDYEKIKLFVLGGSSDDFHLVSKVFLASPGGNVEEAIKIGRLLRTLKIATIIPSKMQNDLRVLVVKGHGLINENNYLCTSACFLVFVAGIQRDDEISGLHEPLLGIHRPYFYEGDLRHMNGDNVMASAGRIKAIYESYLRDMGVPQKYIDAMIATPKGNIRWITKDEFQADFKGFIPELFDWVAVRCEKLTESEKALWEIMKDRPGGTLTDSDQIIVKKILFKLVEQRQCENEVQGQLFIEALLKAREGRISPIQPVK